MQKFTWTCPYCGHLATITQENFSANVHYFDRGNCEGHPLGIVTQVVVCPNEDCRQYEIGAHLSAATSNPYSLEGDPLIEWSLRPQSSSKPFPEYVPAVIREDYEEACAILALSPKASATLSRRCLQGIIRDFWGISKPRLVDEIRALEGLVDKPTWNAIDAVRSIGNIGAHMERDISVIVEVDPDEASLLVRLIEVLIQDWYIRRFEREEHMKMIVAAATAKAAAKTPGH